MPLKGCLLKVKEFGDISGVLFNWSGTEILAKALRVLVAMMDHVLIEVKMN